MSPRIRHEARAEFERSRWRAPLYRRTVRVALLDTRELRMIGDAGPRPPSLDLLARPGWEDRAGAVLARKLIDESAAWDLIELEPTARGR